MHFAITALWVAAQSECPATDGTEFWTNNVFMNQVWAPYMMQQDVTDNTFYQQVQSECSANYVMCPSINEQNMQQLSFQAACTAECQTYYKNCECYRTHDQGGLPRQHLEKVCLPACSARERRYRGGALGIRGR